MIVIFTPLPTKEKGKAAAPIRNTFKSSNLAFDGIFDEKNKVFEMVLIVFF